MQVSVTDRLIIRHLCENDAPFIIELLNDESFIRYIADKNVRNKQDALKYLNEEPLASYKAFGFGLNMVQLKGSGTPIGMCGLLKRDELEHPDIGYAFLPSFWSKGYAREAANAVLADALTEHNLSVVSAVAKPVNESSARLLLDLGFQFKGSVELHGATSHLYEYHQGA